MTHKVVSATEARIHFGQIMREAVETYEAVVAERGGKPHVVVLSMDEYERLRAAGQPDEWREALQEIIDLGASIRARRGGTPLPEPEDIIHQMRGERVDQLTSCD